MSVLTIPLDQLHFGHEANPPINVRLVGRDLNIKDLAASIAAHGLIQALSVRSIALQWFVADGNRRLAALRMRAEAGEIAFDEPVKCDTGEMMANAEETSLAANVMREPLHEADSLEAFRHMQEQGLSADDIASRFGIEPKRVRKILALGSLSPVILAAWREGRFQRDAAAIVRAFTLARSTAEQERVFDKLSKSGSLWSHTIRRELGADNDAAKRWLKTIGIDAYVAAGGKLVEDLFGEDHIVYDLALAEQMAADKLTAEIERIAEQGWSWVELGSNLPQGWTYNWQKLNAEAGKPTRKEARQIRDLELIIEKPGGTGSDKGLEAEAELTKIRAMIAERGWNADQMAKSGAVVHTDHSGGIVYTFGVVRPETAKTKTKEAGKPAEKKAPMLSNALHQRLSAQATLATRAALQQEPRVGLVALLAGMITHRHLGTDSPVRIYHDGFGKTHGGDKESFASAFQRLSGMSDAELFTVAAGLAGEAVHMERPHVGRLPFDNNAGPLAAAIDPGLITAALREQFDAADYFKSASRPFVVQAIREAINDDEARKADKLGKAELVEFATKNVTPTGWLPPELRPATYSGPGAS